MYVANAAVRMHLKVNLILSDEHIESIQIVIMK